jgi:hypothetical protein
MDPVDMVVSDPEVLVDLSDLSGLTQNIFNDVPLPELTDLSQTLDLDIFDNVPLFTPPSVSPPSPVENPTHNIILLPSQPPTPHGSDALP